MARRNHLAKRATRGALAGAAATWAMGRVTSALYAHESEEATRREDEARQGKTAYGVAAEKAAATIDRELSDEERGRYGSGIHWALGAGAGAVYGVLRARFPAASAGFGTLYGTAFWLTIDEGANTLLGLTPPPDDFPWQAHARGLVGHLAFGVASEAFLRVAEEVLPS